MLKVLIVDDEQVNREFLLRTLKPHGDCVAVGTGEAALMEHRRALLAESPFAVVFLDIMLPGIDGLKTLELLRAAEDEHQIPDSARALAIVTTVLDDHQCAARAFMQGNAASFMTKPFQARQIREELAKLGLISCGCEATQ